MNAIHTLSVRTAAAARRLAELELKGEAGGGDRSRLNSVAVRELQSAIEDLHVAIEHLHEMSDGLAAARAEAQLTQGRYEELLHAVPFACVLTDEEGAVLGANGAAGELFNISSRHLRGKPLMLFVADRDGLARLLRMTVPGTDTVLTELLIRPRDRKARHVAVQVQHLPVHDCRGWFFLESDRRYIAPGARTDDPIPPPAD